MKELGFFYFFILTRLGRRKGKLRPSHRQAADFTEVWGDAVGMSAPSGQGICVAVHVWRRLFSGRSGAAAAEPRLTHLIWAFGIGRTRTTTMQHRQT